MKKPISIFLAASIAIPTILTAVSGCVNASAADIMTNGELLDLINTTFGFEGFDESEPYYSSVPSNDAYFEDVQIAKEFLVLDDLVTDVKTDEIVTREFLAMALSGAINDDKTTEVSISDLDKITYIDDVLTVLNYGIMELSDKGDFEPEKQVSSAECVMLVDAAKQVWLYATSNEPCYNVGLVDGVIDLGGVGAYVFDEDTSGVKFDAEGYSVVQEKLKENNFNFNKERQEIKIDSVDEFGIEVGSILTVPTGDEFEPYYPAKVTGISQNSDGTYTITVEEAEMEEYLSSYVVEQVITPDFTTAVIYDADGNPLMPVDTEYVDTVAFFSAIGAEQNVSQSIYSPMSNNGIVEKTGVKAEQSYEVKVKDIFKGSIKVTNDGFTLTGAIYNSDKKETSKHEWKDDNKNKDSVSTNNTSEDSISFSKEFKNIKFTEEADLLKGKFKFVKQQTVVTKLTASSSSGKELDATDGLSHKRILSRANAGAFAKEFHICDVKIPTGIGDLTVNIEVSLGISLTGEITISCTQEGVSTGLEVRNFTKFSRVDDVRRKVYNGKAEAKVEFTAKLDLNVSILAGHVKAGITVTLGVGISASLEVTIIDEAESMDGLLCIEVATYPILKLGLYAKIKFIWSEHTFNIASVTLLDSSSDCKAYLHFESYDIEPLHMVPECTKDARLNKSKDTKTQAAGVTVGNELIISPSDKAFIGVDEELTLNITQVPSGYDYNDIVVVAECNDSIEFTEDTGTTTVKHALSTLDNVDITKLKGKTLTGFSTTIKGVGEGNATISFITTDGKHKASCKVYVGNPSLLTDRSAKLGTYGHTIGVNNKVRLQIDRLPVDITENDLVWKSENPDIATVEQDGTITGISEGYTTITCETPDGTSTAYCTITVSNVGKLSIRFVPDSVIEYQI